MPQFMQPTLHPEVGEPVLAVRRPAGHGAEEAGVDLDDFFHGLRGYPVSGGGAGVGGDDDAALEAEGEGGGAVGDFDRACWVAVVVGHGAEPGGGGGGGGEGEFEGGLVGEGCELVVQLIFWLGGGGCVVGGARVLGD